MPRVTGKGLFCWHGEPGQRKDNLCCDVPQHGVTSGHAPSPLLLLVEVTACQVCQTVNAARTIYSTDPLIYSFCDVSEPSTAQTTSWWAYLTGICNDFKLECAPNLQRNLVENDDDDDEWENESALLLRLLSTSPLTVAFTTLLVGMCRKLQSRLSNIV